MSGRILEDGDNSDESTVLAHFDAQSTVPALDLLLQFPEGVGIQVSAIRI